MNINEEPRTFTTEEANTIAKYVFIFQISYLILIAFLIRLIWPIQWNKFLKKIAANIVESFSSEQ